MGIGIMCIQETHRTESDYWITNSEYAVIFSGNDHGRYAGVGFIIVPFMRKAIYGFVCYSERIMAIKLRIPGGKLQ